MNKIFLQEITKNLQELGFQNKKHSWYKHTNDLIKVIDLQKSEYSELYYVNIGLYVKELGCDHDNAADCKKNPQESHCHFRLRAEAFFADAEIQELNRAIGQRDVNRIMYFIGILSKNVFEGVETINDVRDKIVSDVKYINRSNRRLKEFLGISSS